MPSKTGGGSSGAPALTEEEAARIAAEQAAAYGSDYVPTPQYTPPPPPPATAVASEQSSAPEPQPTMYQPPAPSLPLQEVSQEKLQRQMSDPYPRSWGQPPTVATEPLGGNDRITGSVRSPGSGMGPIYGIKDPSLSQPYQSGYATEPLGQNDSLYRTMPYRSTGNAVTWDNGYMIPWDATRWPSTIRDDSRDWAGQVVTVVNPVRQGKDNALVETELIPWPSPPPGSTYPGQMAGDANYAGPLIDAIQAPPVQPPGRGRPTDFTDAPATYPGGVHSYGTRFLNVDPGAPTVATEPVGDDSMLLQSAYGSKWGQVPVDVSEFERGQINHTAPFNPDATSVIHQIAEGERMRQARRTPLAGNAPGLAGLFGGTNAQASPYPIVSEPAGYTPGHVGTPAPAWPTDPVITTLPGGSPGTSAMPPAGADWWDVYWQWVTGGGR